MEGEKMKPHSHIMPMGSSDRWPYRVCHFDGNEEARKAQKKAMRRYRMERKVGRPGEIKT